MVKGYTRGEFCRNKNRRYPQKLPHMGLYSWCPGCKFIRKNIWLSQVVPLFAYRYVPSSLTILCRFSSSGNKPLHWNCFSSVPCGVWLWVLYCAIHEGGHNPSELDIYCEIHLTKQFTGEYSPQGNLVQSRDWGVSQRNSKTRAKHCLKE